MIEADMIQWEISQLVKAKLFPDEESVLRSALRALFEARPEIRRQMVVRAYVSGEISLGKAAQMLAVSHEEMKDVLIESGAQIHLGPQTIDELLRDAANA
jgi:predicted HTH domain antitoxin